MMRNYKEFGFTFLSLFLIGLMVYGFAYFGGNYLTGKAVINLEGNLNQTFDGVLRLSLKSGEFIPANAKVVVENNGNVYTYSLRELVSENTNTGNFYLQGSSLTGEGEGFGNQGIKEIFPDVFFTANIIANNVVDLDSTPENNQNENPGNEQNNAGNSNVSVNETPNENNEVNQTPETENTETTNASETPNTGATGIGTEPEQTNSINEETTANTNIGTELTSETRQDTETIITGNSPEQTPNPSETIQVQNTNTETQNSETSNTGTANTETGEVVQESSNAETSASESSATESTSPITGGVVAGLFRTISNFFLSLNPTGRATSEIVGSINGKVSAGNDFVSQIKEGNTIVITSVKDSEGNPIPNNVVSFEIKNGELKVTTNYSQEISGFGKGYPNKREKQILLDLSKLNLSLQPGNLKASLVYNNSELLSVETQITKGEISAENETEENLIEISNETIAPVKPEGIVLEENERDIIKERFGDSNIQVTKAEKVKEGILIRYEIGDLWLERLYPDEANLRDEMNRDATLWLKSLASEYSSETNQADELEDLIGEINV